MLAGVLRTRRFGSFTLSGLLQFLVIQVVRLDNVRRPT